MSTFLLPKSLCATLDKCFKDFWWGFPKGKTRNLSLKSWRSICIPRHLGGLGIQNMFDINLALITKLGWQLLSNPDSFWVQQLRAKYLAYGTFLSSPESSNASWLWKGILQCKSTLASGACLQVSLNSNFSIWTTAWIPTLPNFRPLPKHPGNREFSSLFISDLFLSGTHHWNVSTIYSLFDEFSAQEILKIHIYPSTFPKYLWTPAPSGKFTIGSAYQSIMALNHPELASTSSQPFWKSLWKLNLNDRLRLFLWKIAWDILPITSRVNSILPSPNRLPICSLCKLGDDSLHHLFFNCIFARFIWRNSFWPLDSSAFNFISLQNWVQQIISPGTFLNISSSDHYKFQIFAAVACDLLWFYRNKSHHEGIAIDIYHISKYINLTALEHYNNWHPSLSTVIEINKWIPPKPPWITINFDTAIRDSFSMQAVVCRNSQGCILHMVS
jgi:hypothetical protein